MYTRLYFFLFISEIGRDMIYIVKYNVESNAISSLLLYVMIKMTE